MGKLLFFYLTDFETTKSKKYDFFRKEPKLCVFFLPLKQLAKIPIFSFAKQKRRYLLPEQATEK
ncbi:MAG: hypothetical protein A2W46_03640 [Alphaproteobacteria bacterium RIFCSPHIGHO2_12_42_13]|nr:MAG: hypothetical protein A2W46_03640 [Alphaproteobacteria bacterium RIFCSPHIGHO2_12_42_13]HCE95223.1 hypothetical protein [Holosporales bacterium]